MCKYETGCLWYWLFYYWHFVVATPWPSSNTGRSKINLGDELNHLIIICLSDFRWKTNININNISPSLRPLLPPGPSPPPSRPPAPSLLLYWNRCCLLHVKYYVYTLTSILHVCVITDQFQKLFILPYDWKS